MESDGASKCKNFPFSSVAGSAPEGFERPKVRSVRACNSRTVNELDGFGTGVRGPVIARPAGCGNGTPHALPVD